MTRRLLPIGILVGAVVSLFWGIGSHSLWGDEAFSFSTSHRGAGQLLTLSLEKETTGAPYAFVLKAWMSVFGTSETAMRSLSAVCVLIAIGLSGLVGARLGGWDRGVLVMAGLAVHGTVIEYGQTTRFYAFILMFGSVSLLAFVSDVIRPRRLTLVIWLVSSVSLPLNHLLATPFVVAQGLALLALPRERAQLRRRLPVIAVVLVVGLGIAALVHGRDEGQSLIQFGWSALRESTVSLTGTGGIPGVLLVGLPAGIGVIAALRAVSASRRGGESSDVNRLGGASDLGAFPLVLPALGVVVPFVSLIAASVVVPALLGRYLLVCVPCVVLLAAQGIEWIAVLAGRRSESRRTSSVRVAALPAVAAGGLGVIAMVGLGVGATRWMNGDRGGDWRAVSCALMSAGRTDDVVLFANDSIRLFHEYERTQPRPGCVGTGEPAPVFPIQPWGAYRTGDQRYVAFSRGDVEAALTMFPRVWLVVEGEIDLDALIGGPPAGLGTVLIDRSVSAAARVVLLESRQ
jgi:hypothetical protein